MMEDKKLSVNSPVIQKNTPIKRLGLSRKRKSCGSNDSSVNKVQKKFEEKEINNLDENIDRSEVENISEIIDFESEIESLKKIISDKEKKLETLKTRNDNIVRLENLTEVWRNGCKNAYAHLKELLKEKHPENVSCKLVLKQLGIWRTMVENFECDSDMSLSDCSQ